MSKEEKKFLKELAQLSLYWSNLSTKSVMECSVLENENEARINGFIHSLLVLFRGDCSVSDFDYYRLYKGDNEKEIGVNEYLPSKYFEVWKEIKKANYDKVN